MMADQIYKDSIRTPEERAKSLLEEMSLDEKMAQAAGGFRLGKIIRIWRSSPHRCLSASVR